VDSAYAINGKGAGNVARAAASVGATLMHVSTDYVFDGRKNALYVETDEVSPLGVYARSKLEGEQQVQAAGGRWFIVRTGELYGAGGPNFFDAILKRARTGQPLRVVNDQVVTPTWTQELAPQLAVIAREAAPGIYHATCDGQCTWFEAAQEALKQCGMSVWVEPISTEAYGSPTPRPLFSVLSHQKLSELGLYRMRDWRTALGEWLKSKPG
jgi:dTDP-4-dehydrorhamnose reductase